jgi:hypothetical protein
MSPESPEPANLESSLPGEALQPSLQEAVERIVERRVPEDALQRALQRAQQRKPKPTSRVARVGWSKTLVRRLAVAVVIGGWSAAAIVIAVQEADEVARRAQSQNNLPQIALAVHNYHDILNYAGNAGSVNDYMFGPNGGEGRFRENWAKRYLYFHEDERYAKVPVLQNGGTSNTVSADEGQRVIHTAETSLVVKDVLALESKLRMLIAKYKGYTADAQVNEPQQSLRTGKWVVRIPADVFDDFLDAVAELGIPEYRRSNAKDVTEEYVDVTARIANQKKLEQRLLELLENRDGDLKDVIAVEQQLSQVRGVIESREGRRKYLEHRTEMASATIIAREERQYVSPRARTFASEIGLTWSDSLGALRGFGKGLVLVAVAAGPWLLLLIVFGYLSMRGIRRAWRARTNADS